jgi:uncharacterized protein
MSFFKPQKGRFLYALAAIFITLNVVANFHAYKFTHFTEERIAKTKSPTKLSTFDKLKTLAFGVNNPRPTNAIKPQQRYETVALQSNKRIEGWYIKADSAIHATGKAKGTVIVLHGYSSEKSSMLGKATEFLRLGYNTFLIDFMGSGGSEGIQTTLGFKEAEEVKTAFEYLKKRGEQNIYLFGTSMGAVAILKALDDYDLRPQGIILECPFGSMYQTTCARFHTMNAPTFPMAGLLVFWGGVQNSFWAFGHNPTAYAKAVTYPTLLLYGEQDENVSRQEIDEIYANIKGPKALKTYPSAGHENYWLHHKSDWITDVSAFLGSK